MYRSKSFGGRVKQFLTMSVGTAVVSSLAVVGMSSGAGAAVQRYQIQTMSITVALFAPAASSGNVHEYTVTLNPCDGTFVGSGGGYLGLSAPTPYVTESVAGTYVGGSLTLNSTYNGTTYGNPYTYTVGPVSVAPSAETASQAVTFSSGSPSGTYPVWVTLNATTITTFANHGDYVSSMGGGSDNAHACVGMPMQSQSESIS